MASGRSPRHSRLRRLVAAVLVALVCQRSLLMVCVRGSAILHGLISGVCLQIATAAITGKVNSNGRDIKNKPQPAPPERLSQHSQSRVLLPAAGSFTLSGMMGVQV